MSCRACHGITVYKKILGSTEDFFIPYPTPLIINYQSSIIN